MTQLALAEWLARAGAHHDVVEWATPYQADWARAWGECPRADWLLAVAARLGVPRQKLVIAAASCARTALDAVPADERRPLAAIEAAEGWARGELSDDELAARARDADTLATGDPAVASAAAAAHAAAHAATEPSAAAVAAANAVQAAVFGAGDCAVMSLLKFAQRTCADHVRSVIGFAEIEAILPAG